MKHIGKEQWLLYAEDKLQEEERQLYDNHLYECDHCMEIYLEIVASVQTSLPDLENGSEFTEKIMKELKGNGGEDQKSRPRPFYEQTIFHYAIAAAMTILFMFSGVFDSITNYVDEVQNTTLSDQNPSVTERILAQINEHRIGGENK